MNIDLGNYIITSDSLNFILNEKKLYKEGKHVGEEYLATVGYYPTWRGLTEKLFHLELQQADISDLTSVIHCIDYTFESLTRQLISVEKALARTTTG